MESCRLRSEQKKQKVDEQVEKRKSREDKKMEDERLRELKAVQRQNKPIKTCSCLRQISDDKKIKAASFSF